jgi:hypothetical protein
LRKLKSTIFWDFSGFSRTLGNTDSWIRDNMGNTESSVLGGIMMQKFALKPDGSAPTAADSRSFQAEEIISNIRRDIAVQRSCAFDKQLIRELDANPNLTLRQAWESLEDRSANGRRPAPYPRSWPDN